MWIKAFVVRRMAHMLAIKLYTGNMVDRQLADYEWSLSNLQKCNQSPTRSCETQRQEHPNRSLKRGIPLDVLVPKGRLQRTPPLSPRESSIATPPVAQSEPAPGAFPPCTPSCSVSSRIPPSRVSKHALSAQSLVIALVQLAPCSAP